ncbi:MAG: hypothetical protein ACI4EX_03400 [Lachnospiraceae bacterium]
MIWLINYADETYKNAQKYNSYTAKRIGKVDKVLEYTPESIDKEFIEKNKQWFVVGDSQIGKYGLWRPIILQDAYSKINEGDYLIYADAGTFFVNDVHHLTELMDDRGLNILVFSLPFVEKQWTKRDILIRLNADTERITDSNQRMSTCFVIKKSSEGEELINRYKEVAELYPELFTDEGNRLGKDNYPNFIQNRHNQSVLSVLTKSMEIPAFRDPTEYGSKEKLYSFYDIPQSAIVPSVYEKSPYPQILVQHRRGKVTYFVRLYALIRSKFPYAVSATLIKIATLRQRIIRLGKEKL